MTAGYDFTPVESRRHALGEGARALGDGFVFVDLLEGRLFHLGTERPPRQLAHLDVPLGAVAPLAGGGWVAAAGTGFALLRNGVTWLHRPGDGASTPVRMNDGVTDPSGRFWAGSMAYDATVGAGSLYRLDADLSLTEVMDGLTIPNGPAFNAAGDVMYVADTALGTIYRCDVHVDSGEVTERNTFARIEDASPDGMTVDAEGYLWCAMWGGSRVNRYAPDGTLNRSIGLPASQPTSVALSVTHPFSIVITTATHGLPKPLDHDGRVLKAQADVGGLALKAFAAHGIF
ncbi:SMP-30/gluconolactonase/LRE family protein [Phycicoccus sp. Soil802]|uniref:SMP-30/gluconolactonase/LRE family protein n=1 Tax=Phycicoccus sp. Soil802 TaxID=1736414 RepID=UPI0007024DF5|nr:SMP-30/gluconolactonase/LRE family protein [Phycicoccus sp. Soil802]KRF22346.1 hypothetical protein ASG91_18715 [Phycicoccus sp. Soil802]